MLTTLSRFLWVGILFSALLCWSVTAQDSSLVWDKPVTVKRVAKPKRAAKPRPVIQRVPLLTLEWRMLKRLQDGKPLEVNPNTIFHTGDRIRLAIKANQAGYLYIIHHSADQDGTLIFPDSRINNGQNYIQKDQEYVLPAYCAGAEFPDAQDCWWKMTPPGGSEEFVVVFSRDMILNLPNQITVGGESIKLQIINDLKANSGQQLKRTSRPEQAGGAGRYITWVTNTNTKDNEELIETIVLTHSS